MSDAEQKHLTLEEVKLITQQALQASVLSDGAAQAITDVVTQAERDEIAAKLRARGGNRRRSI